MKKISLKLLVLDVAAVLAFSGIGLSAANAHSYKNEGYMTDLYGNVVKNGYNECWRTGYWTPAMANAECDPDLVKKEEPTIVQPEPVRAPAPAPVVIAPPPPQPKPAVVMAPVLKALTFKADAFFAYGKATLSPEGKNELDKLVDELKGAKLDSIAVIGHTDRLGSDAYNMKLSTRRAEAARDYLVNVKGIEAGKVSALGKGESDPMTKPGECKGNKATKKLIACLKSDRRVEIEVSATKEVPAAR